MVCHTTNSHTQLIHRFMYCGMLSKLTKLSKAIKHRFRFECWFSKPPFSVLRGSFLARLVPLESSVSPALLFALVSEQWSLFGCRFLPNAWTFLLKNTNFECSGSGISEILERRYGDFDFMSLKNQHISNLSPGAVGVVHQGCTAQI